MCVSQKWPDLDGHRKIWRGTLFAYTRGPPVKVHFYHFLPWLLWGVAKVGFSIGGGVLVGKMCAPVI